MKKLNLLVCTSEYPPDYSSGIGNVAYNVLEQLKKKGVDCTVCSPNADIKLGSSRMIKKFGILGLLYYWYCVSKYFKGKEEDFDVVWLPNPLFLKDNPFQRSLITIHTTHYGKMIQEVYPKIYYKISSKIERYCLNKIDEKTRFTTTSQQTCKELEKIGINRQRITYIPNGVLTERFKPHDTKKMLRKRIGISENDLIILSFGRLTEVKQPQKLIEVFSVIGRRMENATLVIAGKGDLLDKTKEFVRQKKIKNIIFLGYVDKKDVPNLYACSDVYIMASKCEGQPLTLLEAMSSGLPPIVSNIPILNEFVEESKAGIVVDFNDTKIAANKIVEYLKDEQLIQKQSEQVRRFITNGWDWKDISRKYLEEFQKVIQYRNKGKIP